MGQERTLFRIICSASRTICSRFLLSMNRSMLPAFVADLVKIVTDKLVTGPVQGTVRRREWGFLIGICPPPLVEVEHSTSYSTFHLSSLTTAGFYTDSACLIKDQFLLAENTTQASIFNSIHCTVRPKFHGHVREVLPRLVTVPRRSLTSRACAHRPRIANLLCRSHNNWA